MVIPNQSSGAGPVGGLEITVVVFPPTLLSQSEVRVTGLVAVPAAVRVPFTVSPGLP